MGKDDYHTLVFKILTYLYKQLKNGDSIDESKISACSLGITDDYWEYVFSHMQTEGLVEGVSLMNVAGRNTPIVKVVGSRIRISPKGIEYLEDNSMMSKARELIKDIGGLIP